MSAQASVRSIVSNEAKIGQGVYIHPFVTIYGNVEIGDNTTIEEYSVVGYPTPLAGDRPLVIGHNSHIRTHSILYEGSTIGPHLTTGHRVLIRENSVIGRNVHIGSLSDIEGDCQIGAYTRLHSEVHVSKGSVIGDLVWLYPRVQFTNDPLPPSGKELGITVKDMAVVATGTLLLPGVVVGLGSVVGAGSVVRQDIPDVYLASGDPAKPILPIDKVFNPIIEARYPWAKYRRKGYPADGLTRMDELLVVIDEKLKTLRVAK